MPVENLNPGVESPVSTDLCLKLRRAADYIERNLRGRLPLAEVAAQAGLNPQYFARLFRKASGMSPHQYIIEKRVERAKELLKTTDLPLADVASHVGIATQSHFTTVFRRVTGMTPREFRDK